MWSTSDLPAFCFRQHPPHSANKRGERPIKVLIRVSTPLFSPQRRLPICLWHATIIGETSDENAASLPQTRAIDPLIGVICPLDTPPGSGKTRWRVRPGLSGPLCRRPNKDSFSRYFFWQSRATKKQEVPDLQKFTFGLPTSNFQSFVRPTTWFTGTSSFLPLRHSTKVSVNSWNNCSTLLWSEFPKVV